MEAWDFLYEIYRSYFSVSLDKLVIPPWDWKTDVQIDPILVHVKIV